MAKEIRRIDVHFRDPNSTYRAGDVVSGVVCMEVSQDCKIKGIKLHLQGISRVHWDEKRAYTKGSASKVAHKNVDAYLDEPLILPSKGRSDGTYGPGRYDWPFDVRLPPYLPASYEGHWGRVQYCAKINIERPWSKSDVDFTKLFTVMGSLDLNTEPDAKKPIENMGEIMAGTLCCTSGPITGHLILDRRGFVSGQGISFVANLDNKSKKKVSVRIALVQQVTFRVNKDVRKTTNVLKVLTREQVKAGDTLQWEEEMGSIPPVPPSRLGGGCKNIEVKYILKLIAFPTGPGKDMEVPVEIIIGTVPFRKAEPGSAKLTVKGAAKKIDSGDSLRVQKPRPSLTPSPAIERANP